MTTRFTFIMMLCLFYANSASALECYAMINGIEKPADTVEVKDIIIPTSTKNGEIIWESDEYKRDIVCRKGIGEYVYFYPFPNLKSSDLPAGMSFGLIFNGEDYPLVVGQQIETKIYAPPGGGDVKGTVDVKVYIKKTGAISSGFSTALPIYQLDGKGGINSSKGKNFIFSLTNLENIATADCTYQIKSNKTKNDLLISDVLLASTGKTIGDVGTMSVSCQPYDLLSGRTAVFDISTTSSGSDLFGTNKDGLSYYLMMNNKTLKPANTSSNPSEVSFILDSTGNASASIDQIFTLDNTNHDWLYTADTATTSNDPKLTATVRNFN